LRIANIEYWHGIETPGRNGRNEALLLSASETANIRYCQRPSAEPLRSARSNEETSGRQASAWFGNEEQTQRVSACGILAAWLQILFPAELGQPSRGLPTAYAAPPLNAEILPADELPTVWPGMRVTFAVFLSSPCIKACVTPVQKILVI